MTFIPLGLRRFFIFLLVGAGVLLIVGYREASQTDPYWTQTRISAPFQTEVTADGQIKFVKTEKPSLETSQFGRLKALFATGVRIPLYSLLLKEEPLAGDEDAIITEIHKRRFDPSKPYVITGSHYSDLYMRNMGVFFNALLDPRLPTSQEDWQNRQRIALQTIAYDLAFLETNEGQAVTTIAPLPDNKFVGLNIYKEPSDSLFGVLYSLRALQDENFVTNRFPLSATASASPSAQPLITKTATTQLLNDNRETLTKSLNHYLATVIDPATSLVRRDIHISSARDGIKRESSFYDNVIAWATVQLADELQVPHSPTPEREAWKQKIITTYWDENVGIFRNDLATTETIFSADSLIVTSTGFLDLNYEPDRVKLERTLTYIRQNQLNQPFPLRYSRSNDTNDAHLTVKYLAPSYMGDGIWSHWGMEFIKALLLTARPQNDHAALAAQHLEKYRQNIEKFGGYPELYDSRGEMFHSTLVRGVLHTGWVVNYEQAKMMVDTKPVN